MADKRRVHRVASRIREIVAQKVLDLTDPRFSMVTITSAVVSPDLRHAKVYWSLSADDKAIEDTTAAFKKAEGLFRKALAEDLGVRFVPSIKFFFDSTLATQDEVSRLLNEIK